MSSHRGYIELQLGMVGEEREGWYFCVFICLMVEQWHIWNKFSNIINIYEISRSALAYLTLENFYNGIYGTRRCTNRICLQKSQI
jgi:hypothetical protein